MLLEVCERLVKLRILLLAIVALFSCSFSTAAPTITSISPSAAPWGTTVTITGTNFGSTQGTSTVVFYAAAGTPTSWSDTSIVVPVPFAARTGSVVVTVGGAASNGFAFSVVPHIDSINPRFGPVGTSVGIGGEGFGETQGSSTVTFNGITGTPTYWDNSTIRVPVPNGATNGNIQVTVGGLPSNGVGFAVTAPSFGVVQSNSGRTGVGSPSVRFASNNTTGNLLWVAVGSDNPITTPTDTLGNSYTLAVSINGVSGFGNAAIYYVPSAQGGANSVTCNQAGTIGTTMCQVAEVAGLASNAPLDQIGSLVSSSVCSVSTTGATTQANEWVAAFFYDTALSQMLTSIPPYLTIQWMLNNPLYTRGALSEGGVPAWTGVQTANCGGVGTSEPVTQLITTFKPQSSGSGPSISGLSPASGAVGTSVTITGTNFGTTQGTSTVKFNGTTATVTSWSASSIVATVPSGATTGNVVVNASGVNTNGVNFTVLPTPNITNLSPTSGAVGTTVTITGTNFGTTQGTSTVNFNGTTATPTSWSATSIVVPVPSGATSGSVVVNVGGLPSNSANFTVLPTPVVTSLSPISGTVGTSVTVTGTNFGTTQGTSTVTFNGMTATPTNWSATTIIVPVPSGATSGNVVITIGGVASNGQVFTVSNGPLVTSLSPSSGSVGTQVTITGMRFGATQGSSAVFLGGRYSMVVDWSDTQIHAIVPSGSTTGVAQVTQSGITSNAVNFSVVTPVIATVNPTAGSAGTQVTIAGSNFGAVQGYSQILIGTVPGTVVSWSDSQVIATVTPGSSSGKVQMIQGLGSGSNYVSFTITSPAISNVTPSTGTPGTQVNISGSGFGAVQGTGTVWLGTTLGTVVSWSDNQITAVVTNGSSTGSAQIQQGGVASNAIPFTVNSAMISSITPTSGIPGTQVTINGSGFGAAQGSGTVWLGSLPGVVTSWSDGQVVATVALGASSGKAQILQNGVWSNSITFPMNQPHISNITPNNGPGGTVVTINGNGFGVTQGSGSVRIGSADGLVTSWSDAQVVASVASSSLSGIVKIQQNSIWSNAVTFTVPSGGGTSVSLNPNVITMQVGTTRSIQALDASGQPATGLAWTSSNTSVATLSTDDPPVITGLSVGYTTITAGNASADVTVLGSTVLPIGSVICSNPGNASGVVSIVPAVPSPTGVADVFALQGDGNLLAITSDCLTAWTAFVGTGKHLIPDFQGGLVVADTESIYRLDGITGQPYPPYTSAQDNPLQTPVVHTDGTVFTVDGDYVVGINPQIGQPRVSVHMEDSTVSSSMVQAPDALPCYDSPLPQGSGSLPPGSSYPAVGNLMIAGDGYVYVPYTFGTGTSVTESMIPDPTTQLCTSMTTSVGTEYLRLLRVGTQGDSSIIGLGSWGSSSFTGPGGISESAPAPTIELTTPITDADRGVLFAWSADAPRTVPICPPGTLFASGCMFENTPVNLTRTAGNSVASQTTLHVASGIVQPMLQRADDSFVGTDGTNMFAFTASGAILWTVPNDTPRIATADGGVVGYSGVTYDQSGNASGQLGSLPTYSWTNNAYRLGSVESFKALALQLANGSYWAFAQGNASANSTASQPSWFPPLDSCNATPGCIGHYEAIYNALADLLARLNDPTIITGPGGPTTLSGLAQSQIFDKLGNDANGKKLTTQSFVNYLTTNTPRFYNGPASTYCYDGLVSGDSCSTLGWVNNLIHGGTLITYFSINTDDAITKTPGKPPLMVFFRPNSILYPNLGKNLGNESVIFHEALHGLTGLLDRGTIERPLGILEKLNAPSSMPSCYISGIIASDVLSHSGGIDSTESPCQ